MQIQQRTKEFVLSYRSFFFLLCQPDPTSSDGNICILWIHILRTKMKFYFSWINMSFYLFIIYLCFIGPKQRRVSTPQSHQIRIRWRSSRPCAAPPGWEEPEYDLIFSNQSILVLPWFQSLSLTLCLSSILIPCWNTTLLDSFDHNF